MEQRHINCADERCRICMTDHLALGDKLDKLTGNDKVDHLGKFHSWLSTQNIEPETEHGWGTEAYFDDGLIKRYVKEFRTEMGYDQHNKDE